MIRLSPLVLLLLVGLSVPSRASSGADAIHFAVIGDMPYYDLLVSETRYRALIDAINRLKPPFTLHVGDIKASRAPCDDARFLKERAHFQLFDQPLIYTPGDNEWTDCHRAKSGPRDPIERLARLRELFFARPDSLGAKPMRLESQAADPKWRTFVENRFWRHGRVHFATVHLVGSNNNLRPRNDEAMREYREREAAGIAWIRRTFERAAREDAPAVVIVTHGNPFMPTKSVSGFAPTVKVLRQEATRFAKPVLLVHGDSHRRRLDQPFRGLLGNPVPNFWRLETFGHPQLYGLRVILDPSADPPVVAHTISGDVIEDDPFEPGAGD